MRAPCMYSIFDVNSHCSVNGPLPQCWRTWQQRWRLFPWFNSERERHLLTATRLGGLAGWILDRQYLRERLWIPLCLLWRQWGAEPLTAFDSGVLSSENIGQRCEISIWASEAQPAIWIKSGAISFYIIDQNLDWTLEGCLYLQTAVELYTVCAWITYIQYRAGFIDRVLLLSAATKPRVCKEDLIQSPGQL